MKKIVLAFAFVFLTAWGFSQEEEIMIINPGRETFVHFPSQVLGNQYTLTVFLPEKAVPLSKQYPVIYLLGAGPQQALDAQRFLEKNKVLVVGINFKESDYQDQDKIVEFVSRELIPYIDTNYLTLTDPSRRILAAHGEQASLTALELFAKPNLFGGLALASSGNAIEKFVMPLSGTPRIFVTGNQTELALAQQKLEKAGLVYGSGFALNYASAGEDLFAGLDWEYLAADSQAVSLDRLTASTDKRVLVLNGEDKISLFVTAFLKNGRSFVYVPVSLRMSPPYLVWNPMQGVLSGLPGAEPGKVKIRGGVDKKGFYVKIKLKK